MALPQLMGATQPKSPTGGAFKFGGVSLPPTAADATPTGKFGGLPAVDPKGPAGFANETPNFGGGFAPATQANGLPQQAPALGATGPFPPFPDPGDPRNIPAKPGGPYGTGIPNPKDAPYLPPTDTSGKYGSNRILDLDDLNNPNLSPEDRYYLAGLYVYFNPSDEAGWKNYFNWQNAMKQGDKPAPPPEGPPEPRPPIDPPGGPPVTPPPGPPKMPDEYTKTTPDTNVYSAPQPDTMEYRKGLIQNALKQPMPNQPKFMGAMDKQFGTKQPGWGDGREAWKSYTDELAYYWPDYDATLPKQLQGRFNPFGKNSPIV